MVIQYLVILLINIILTTEAKKAGVSIKTPAFSEYYNTKDMLQSAYRNEETHKNKRMVNSVFKNSIFERIIKQHKQTEILKEKKRKALLELQKEKENEIFQRLLAKNIKSSILNDFITMRF